MKLDDIGYTDDFEVVDGVIDRLFLACMRLDKTFSVGSHREINLVGTLRTHLN